MRMPKGYDTEIEENGGNLSAGQKQLLCIARVMLHLPPILILDEATSSVDTRTEQRIQTAMDRLMQGRTSFVIAHRLSTIRHADRILVLTEDGIVEAVVHETLPVLGVQYHPERQSFRLRRDDTSDAAALFRWWAAQTE